MIAVSEAQALVYARVRALAAEVTQLTPACLGMVLAEPIIADLDVPPFTKALMDGYAVRSADLGAEPIGSRRHRRNHRGKNSSARSRQAAGCTHHDGRSLAPRSGLRCRRRTD